MPSHTHTQDAHSHGVSDPSHAHTQRQARTTVQDGPNGGLGYNHFGGVGDSNLVTANSTTGISIVGATATNQYTGGGAAHNIMQPTILLNYIIKI